MLAQFIPYLGWGHYFPWSIPGIYCGAAGEEFKNRFKQMELLVIVFYLYARLPINDIMVEIY